MFTTSFWKAAAERALKTGAQAVILLLLGGALTQEAPQINAFLLDWGTAGGVFLGGGFLSVLTSLVTAAATDGSPSLGNVEVVADKASGGIVNPEDRLPGEPDHRIGS